MNTNKEYKHISIQQVLSDIIQFCAENPYSIFHSIKYPGLGILLLSLFTRDKLDLLTLLLYIPETYFYYILVVRCHRLFLLNEQPNTYKEALRWSSRNTTFVLTSIALSFGMAVFFIPCIFVMVSIEDFALWQDNRTALIFFITIPIGYLFSRFSLIFPAIAIDKHYDFHHAWDMSKGNGWRLFFLISVVPLITSYLVDIINGDHVFFKVLASLLGMLVLLLEILILSNSFRILDSNYKKT